MQRSSSSTTGQGVMGGGTGQAQECGRGGGWAGGPARCGQGESGRRAHRVCRENTEEVLLIFRMSSGVHRVHIQPLFIHLIHD